MYMYLKQNYFFPGDEVASGSNPIFSHYVSGNNLECASEEKGGLYQMMPSSHLEGPASIFTMGLITETHCRDKWLGSSDKSPRLHCCYDKAVCTYFVTAICCTNSNQLEFVRRITTTISFTVTRIFAVTQDDLL